MYTEKINRIVSICEENNIKVEKGLSDKQIELAQDYYEITFPPDLKELLGAVKPVKHVKSFPFDDKDTSYFNPFFDWSDFSEENVSWINKYLNLPIEGVLFDVENNHFWLESWGEKPFDLEDKLLIAKNQMKKFPKLIPVMGHRYISSEPNEAGNPVYSVSQTDIVLYGENLWEYFEADFGKKESSDIELSAIKKIPFWHDILLHNYARMSKYENN